MSSNYVSVIYPSGISSSFSPAFEEAVNFWNNVVTGGSSGYTFPSNYNTQQGCGVAYTFPAGSSINGLAILAQVQPIDGRGGILGQAGPCALLGNFPLIGIMTFDSADSQSLVNQGQFYSVIVHEMGHVVGIGGLWSQFNLVRDACTGSPPCRSNPTYVGANGIEGYRDLGGQGALLVGDERGPGTWNAHWREDFFVNELMTGFLDSAAPNPLSIMSIKSLKDQGYSVNLFAAEDYSIQSEFARPFGGEKIELVGEMLEFDAVDIEVEMARIEELREDEDYMHGLGALILLGFALMAGAMIYSAKKQKKQLLEFALNANVAPEAPMKQKSAEP